MGHSGSETYGRVLQAASFEGGGRCHDAYSPSKPAVIPMLQPVSAASALPAGPRFTYPASMGSLTQAWFGHTTA
jgi:hypothetical protein